MEAALGSGGGGWSNNDGVSEIRARGGGSSGGDGRGGDRSLSPILCEQPLEREFTHFFLKMIARVCGGGVPSPLI